MSDELGLIQRVLVVDDDPSAGQLLGVVLKDEGFDATICSSASRALEHVRDQRFGVAILDVRIGTVSGVELLSALQREDEAIRIILYTGLASLESAKQAVNLGAHAYLEKETDPSELLRTVHGAFQSRFRRYARGLEELVEARTRSLHASEQRFRDLAETASDWIWETDSQGRYTYCGPQVSELLGYAPEDLLGRFILDIVPDESRRPVNRAVSVVRRTQSRFRNAEMPLLRKDGSIVVHELRWVPVLADDGTVEGYRGIGRDITEARRLQTQLWQTQKLDAVGRLAGGIAHDFNNLLTVIMGNSELLTASAASPDEVRAIADSSLETAVQGSRLTKRLLSFARQRPMESRIFDLGASVVGLQDMLARLIGSHIVLETRATDEGLWIRADPGQIEQVLINLAINAKDAMSGGGRFSIEAAMAPSELVLTEKVDPDVMRPLDCVGLSVTDTGSGIAPEHIDKIFEPFFSTKGPAEGTGLGLASVYGIVRQSEGDIQVESVPGRGTTFRIYFPLAPAPETATTTERVRETSDGRMDRSSGGRRILLVDDEPSVLRLAERILSSAGYRVTACGSGAEALEVAKASDPAFDLLVTDMIMPEMMGSELTRRLRERHPSLPVLLVSGYSDVDELDSGSKGATGSLEKPFTSSRLREAVRALMPD